MAQFSPYDRDRARQRVGTATVGIAILAVGATGAASVLAWHATAEASAATKDRDSGSSRANGDDDGEHSEGSTDDKKNDGKKEEGGDWSGVSGGGDLPPSGITPTEPPKKGSGSGSVGSQGS